MGGEWERRNRYERWEGFLRGRSAATFLLRSLGRSPLACHPRLQILEDSLRTTWLYMCWVLSWSCCKGEVIIETGQHPVNLQFRRLQRNLEIAESALVWKDLST